MNTIKAHLLLFGVAAAAGYFFAPTLSQYQPFKFAAGMAAKL